MHGIDNYARYNAVIDVVAPVQLFQVVLAQAARQGIQDGIGLIELENGQRPLDKAGREVRE